MRKLTDDEAAAVAASLAELAPSLLAGVDRAARVVVTGADGPILALGVVITNGNVAVHPDPAAGDGGVEVTVTVEAAKATAAGDTLIEDAFAAGDVRLAGETPDDFRLAPMLELLLEELDRAGALDR